MGMDVKSRGTVADGYALPGVRLGKDTILIPVQFSSRQVGARACARTHARQA
jgi:hypothetical protein